LKNRPNLQNLKDSNIFKERNNELAKAILRDRLNGRLASAWKNGEAIHRRDESYFEYSHEKEKDDDTDEKEDLNLEKHEENKQQLQNSNDEIDKSEHQSSPKEDSNPSKQQLENLLNSKLQKRPSKGTLIRNHILIDGDPSLVAKKIALQQSFLEKKLNTELSKKYGSFNIETNNTISSDEGASMSERSKFIKQKEEEGYFVCHKCTSLEYRGVSPNTFISNKYPFERYFKETDTRQLGVKPPFHHPDALKEALCNICFGACTCGNLVKPNTIVCENCGSLPPTKKDSPLFLRTNREKKKSKNSFYTERGRTGRTHFANFNQRS